MFYLRTINNITFSIISLISIYALPAHADNTLFTAMDDPSTAKKPFEGNVQAGYNAQSGNSENSTLQANSTLTWFNIDKAYSLWGTANNTTSAHIRSSEKYQLGARTRYNMSEHNYLFGQASWLNDRYSGYRSRTTLTGGYGRQLFKGPLHDLRVEFGPGIRHDEYSKGGRSSKALAYGAMNYAYQITDNAKFTQGIAALTNEDTTINSETALDVAINNDFSLRVSYTVTYNNKPPASTPKHTDTATAVTLVYGL